MRQSGAVRKYYNPELTEEEADVLDWENNVVLGAVQASLGCISADMRAIFVSTAEGTATFHFVVADGRSEAVAEDVEDILTDFEASTSGTPGYHTLESEVLTEEIPRDWVQRRWRGVYWSKGWKAWTDPEPSDGGP